LANKRIVLSFVLGAHIPKFKTVAPSVLTVVDSAVQSDGPSLMES
jgi:hypothetical protein